MARAGRAPMLAPFAAYAKSAARSARARSHRVAVRLAVAFRSWPEAAKSDVRSNVGYWGVKRTSYAKRRETGKE